VTSKLPPVNREHWNLPEHNGIRIAPDEVVLLWSYQVGPWKIGTLRPRSARTGRGLLFVALHNSPASPHAATVTLRYLPVTLKPFPSHGGPIQNAGAVKVTGGEQPHSPSEQLPANGFALRVSSSRANPPCRISRRAGPQSATVLSFSQRTSAPVPSWEQVVPLYLAPQLVQLELDLLLKLYPLPLLGHRVI
jgi:hypothetical protein